MENPIRYNDLFGEDIESGLASLIGQIGQVEGSILNMLKSVKQEASSIGDALGGMSSATKGDRDATAQYVAEIERLHDANEKLSKSLNKVQDDLEKLRKKKGGAKDDNVDLAQSYSSLADLIRETGVSIEDLLQSDRQLTIAKKNGENANNSLKGSYNQLYAQYNLIKNVLNAMGVEMRNNTQIGKKWEAEAARLMTTMKDMQEATGKHTLSVGDYSKALNGLQISTQQVLREMPTLANSLQQFFMAISNNVPIFVDSVKRVKEETGSWQIAMRGVLTSLFSWQTALLVVLTLLPKIAKAIHDKKKAQEEDNEETGEAISLSGIHRKTLLEEGDALSDQTGKLKELYAIMMNVNRSNEDRISAMNAIHRLFGIEVSDIDDTTQAVANYIAILDKQAEAESKIARIIELKSDIRRAESKIASTIESEAYIKSVKKEVELQQELSDARIKARNTEGGAQDAMQKAQDNLLNAQLRLNKAQEKTNDLTREQTTLIENSNEEIKRLQEELTADYLDLLDRQGRGAKGSLDKIEDYYWQWRESMAKQEEDDVWRSIALNDLKYEHQIEKYKDALEELKKYGDKTIQEQKYVNDIITNLTKERVESNWKIIAENSTKVNAEIMKKYEQDVNEVIEEQDMSISARYEKLIATQATNVINAREKLNDALVNGTFKEAKQEGEAFKQATIDKLKIEEQYQEALLKMRLDVGEITSDQYKIELANLQIKLGKDIANLSKGKRGKFSIWNLVLGETKEDGKGNVYRELSAESQAFSQQFEKAMSSAISYMDDWMDKRMEMAETAIEAAEKESEATKTLYEYELEARANGYANNVELARKEYEEKLKLEKQAIAEKERLQKIQERIDSATQASSLITATAELWASYSSLPLVGQALAIAATAAMWGSFISSKTRAKQLTYGEGMSEYLDYGGSHASGNDIDFGVSKDGRRRRVERGEVIGVINKRNVNKYGVGKVTDIIDSLNQGTFDSKYGTLVDTTRPDISAGLYELAFNGMERNTDLSVVERGIKELVEQGETKVVATPYGRIEYRGNNKRIIRNS